MSIQLLNRHIGMRDTKANIEAFTGTLEEQAISFTTDTSEFGIYTNGDWVWIDASANAGYHEILIEDGSSSPPVMLTNEDEDDFLYSD